MKAYQVCLPYYKQGDDMRASLACTCSPAEALRDQADMLESAARQLRDVADKIAGVPDVSLEGDTHWIHIIGPEELLEELAELQLVCAEEIDDDEIEDEVEDWDYEGNYDFLSADEDDDC